MEDNENTQDRFISLKALNPSKAALKSLAQQVSQQVKDGDIDPISMSVRAAAMINLCEEIRKEIEPVVTDALSRNKEPLTWGGATVEAAEVGTKYDYSSNEDWVRLKNEEAEIAEKRKAIEEKMKKIPAGKELVDTDTGEVLTGAIKSSKSSFKITLAKT